MIADPQFIDAGMILDEPPADAAGVAKKIGEFGSRTVKRLSGISQGGDGRLHAGDGHAAFADGGGATFDRTGTHIADRENTRAAGFERSGQALVRFPRRRVGHIHSSLDESLGVARSGRYALQRE